VKCAVAAILGLSLISGCATFGGDMIVRVSGRLPTGQDDDRRLECELSMRGENDNVVSSKPVGAVFSVPMMVVVGPEAKDYNFVVQCRDGRRFESHVIQIISKRAYSRNIELGELQER